MSDVRELYQEVILDHNRRPRNRGSVDDASHRAEGSNPICGDRVEVSVRLEDGVLEELKFDGAGCAICMASSSLMTEALQGRSADDAEGMFQAVHDMFTAGTDVDAAVGKLRVLEGVKEYPLRVKCATLPWHTLRSALAEQAQGPVSTE